MKLDKHGGADLTVGKLKFMGAALERRADANADADADAAELPKVSRAIKDHTSKLLRMLVYAGRFGNEAVGEDQSQKLLDFFSRHNDVELDAPWKLGELIAELYDNAIVCGYTDLPFRRELSLYDLLNELPEDAPGIMLEEFDDSDFPDGVLWKDINVKVRYPDGEVANCAIGLWLRGSTALVYSGDVYKMRLSTLRNPYETD